MSGQYTLTEEQKALQLSVREIVDKYVRPRADEIDRQKQYPFDIFKVFGEYGLYGIAAPEEYGGTGLGYLAVGLAYEEINKACMSSGFVLATQLLAMEPIMVGGTAEQKKKYLTPLIAGEKLGAFSLSEPEAGSDNAAMRTVARRDGDGYRINGQKCFCSCGNVADLIVLFCKTDPAAGARGVSAFIVEKGAPGLIYGRVEEKMGLNGSPTAELIFEDCWVPEENLLGGEEGIGFKIAMQTLDPGRAIQAGMAIGVAQGALDYAVNYARERVAFGKPIAAFQGLQFMMAERATELEAARQLAYKAMALADAHDPEVTRIGAMAKLFASEVALRVCNDAIQILGGHGYMKSHPVERMYRDARFLTFGEGTSEIQKIVIARNLIGRL